MYVFVLYVHVHTYIHNVYASMLKREKKFTLLCVYMYVPSYRVVRVCYFATTDIHEHICPAFGRGGGFGAGALFRHLCVLQSAKNGCWTYFDRFDRIT